MASLSDILTTAKNVVTAINNLSQTYLGVQGITNQADISVETLVKNAPGRVCSVMVSVAGSAPGAVYDANSATAMRPSLFVIPNTVGIYVVNMPADYGIVVDPGTGQTVTISYS
jgi:hypothetical protein